MSQSRITATRWLLFVYCALFGILIGAGMYQHFVIIPGWASQEDIVRTYQHGYGFFPFVTPPLTLVAITLAIVGWRSPQPLKRWLYVSLAPFIVLDVMTFAVYLPWLQKLQSADMSALEFADSLSSWERLDRLRQIPAVVLYAAGLYAYGLSVRAVALSREATIHSVRADDPNALRPTA